MLSTAFDLGLVILGFSLIIVIHELGHFLAARWAGVRVLAFAVGFGPALASFRKGIGWRAGSTETEYQQRLAAFGATEPTAGGRLSPTEYRLNVLPLGGYVKMLGQDDADPAAVSNAPDGYQRCPIPKRMVIISAGVIANIVSAAALFCIVFMMGLKTEAPALGEILPDSPAAKAVLVNPDALAAVGGEAGATGLQPGDRVLAINGDPVRKFQDITLKVLMARRDATLEFVVEREGVEDQLIFQVAPREDEQQRILAIGAGVVRSTELADPKPGDVRDTIGRMIATAAPGAEPGMVLTSVEGAPVTSVYDLDRAVRIAAGEPVRATFATKPAPDGSETRSVETTIRAFPELQRARVERLSRDAVTVVDVPHVAGIAPVLRVEEVMATGAAKGLRKGDIFTRLGPAAYPSLIDGTRTIQQHKGREIAVRVLRREGGDGNGAGGEGEWREVDLGEIEVDGKGRIGFMPGGADEGVWAASWPAGRLTTSAAAAPLRGMLAPGSRVVAVNGEPVTTLASFRAAMQQIGPGETAEIEVEIPGAFRADGAAASVRETVRITITPDSQREIAALGWVNPLATELFEPEYTVLKADNPVGAVGEGLRETHSVMTMTYLTFLRLFQGTVKVEHLRGPVGIAHTGTILAGRGWVWLMFFLALVSINLAVFNFLPIPITDGGHFLFLIYEAIVGRPPAAAVQNAAALLGLVLLGGLFLFVMINDIRQLISGGL